MKSNDYTWVFWVVALNMIFLVGFVLLVTPVSAGGESSQGNANYEDYIDSPISQELSAITNGVDTTGQSPTPMQDNITYLDFNGNPIPRDGSIKYYGQVYTVGNSSIKDNLKTPLWINYTMPPQFEGVDAPYPIFKLEQGADVYLDTHYDVSAVLAGTGVIAWFPSGVPNGDEVPVLCEMPYQKRGYYDFYLNPDTFGPYTGNWFKWYNGELRPNENTLAFYITPTMTNTSMTFNNGTVINTTINIIPIDTNTSVSTPDVKPPTLPQVRVSDYLQARGDDMSVTFNGSWKLWLFGSTASLLDQRDYNGTVDIGKDAIQSLPAGHYKLVQQQIGPYASDFTFRYNKEKDSYEWFDPKTFAVKTEDITSVRNTWISYEKLVSILPTTQDRFTVWDLELEEPSITINQMDEVGLRKAKDFYLMDDVKGNVTFQAVKGYTNLAPGTRLTVYLDYDKSKVDANWDNKPVTCTVEDNGGPGYKRVFNATVAIYYNDMSPGMHTITIMTDAKERGVVTQADFMINEMPSNSYVPAQTVKWIGDVNPWSLNTTVQPPQIVEQVVTKEVVVVKEVPPPESVVKAQQMAALIDLVLRLALIPLVVGLLAYARSVYKRTKEIKRKQEWMRWKN